MDIIEKAFLAGRSKTSWKKFKNDNKDSIALWFGKDTELQAANQSIDILSSRVKELESYINDLGSQL